MRVTILTVGSRGDVQPCLALGVGLERAGHHVRVATHPKFEPLVGRAGLGFATLAEGRLSEGPGTREDRRWMQGGSRCLPTWVGFVQDARSVARRRLSDAVRACQDSEAIVCADLAVLLGWQMSTQFGVPLVRARLNPPPRLMSGSGRSVSGMVRQGVWLAVRPWLGSVRADVGLPPLPISEPIAELDRRRTPVVCAWSPAVMPKPPRGARWTRVTGYWFLDQNVDPAPPPALVEFLAAGPPPVCIAFGSMLDADRARSIDLAIAALGRAGRRGVLIRGQHACGRGDSSAAMFAIDSIAHGWLFPRCAAIVHYAAAGTTAAALRAGVPSVPVPHVTNQYPWAERIHKLGVSTAPIPRRKLSIERLHQAIAEATSDGAMSARAATLGQRIRAEDGVARAVEVIQHHLEHSATAAG